MTTLKTPLPEKLTPNLMDGDYKARNIINQLITYLAELTEVVEGKVDKGKLFYQEKSIRDREEVYDTPTLKETLLGEINKLPRHSVVTRWKRKLKQSNMKPYNDFAQRNGSQSFLSKVGETALVVLLALFIVSLASSFIWGAEGFTNLLASFF